MITIKRIYDEPAADDGCRVLVDRLWPRGVRKENAALDYWLKEVAPSPELRQWFNHQPARFAEFQVRYTQELAHNEAVATIRELVQQQQLVTLLYAAKDPKMNNAAVLRDFLNK